MSRRPARITQAEVARIIKAAKQAGATEVVVQVGEAAVVVKLSTDAPKVIEGEAVVVVL
jgi:2-iminoacetate synthase ThiH